MKFDPTLSWNDMFNGGMGFLLTQARNAFLVEMDKELAPFSLTAQQFLIIVGAAHRRAGTLAEFSQYLCSDAISIKRVLDKIEDRGLIYRVRDQFDRRTWRVQLTNEGIDLYPKLMKSANAVHARALGALSVEEVAQFRKYLHRIMAPGDFDDVAPR